MQTLPPPSPLDWMSSHWAQLVGFSAVATTLFRFYVWMRKLIGYGDSIEATRADIALLMTNHLPHIQIELERVNENLSGLRGDIKDNLNRLSDDIRVVLTRME